MILKINGKEENIEMPGNLLQLIKAKGLQPERIVVEYNRHIASRDAWETIALSNHDTLEIISFVGGG